jgi:hypothetical protein
MSRPMQRPEDAPRRHRGIGWWLVTALDDLFVEQALPRLRRGDISGALGVLGNVAVGFWGCAAMLVVVAIAITVLVLVL